MCRLCAMTETGTGPVQRAMLMDRMLLLNNADSVAQRDGWGVSDGVKVFKDKASYRNYDPTPWMDGLANNKIWIGHLRNASLNTTLDQESAHPYQFPHFTAAHNGVFQGSHKAVGSLTDVENVVNTDSWRAFYKLNQLIGEGKTIEECVDSWSSLFEDTSAFVCLILQENILHIVRGPKNRELYYVQFGDGLIFNTDDVVLKNMGSYLEWVTGEKLGAVQEFPELHYAQLERGKTEFLLLRQLAWSPEKAYSTTFYSTNGSAWGNNRQPSAAQKQTKGKWMRLTDGEVDENADAESFKLWIEIRQLLYPMREELATIYLASFVNRTNCTSYEDASREELQALLTMIKNDPLTDKAKKVLHLWNYKVHTDDELATFYVGFYDLPEWFWNIEDIEYKINTFDTKVVRSA